MSALNIYLNVKEAKEKEPKDTLSQKRDKTASTYDKISQLMYQQMKED